MRDENQIAASILRIATTTEPRPGESPRHRANRANGAGLAQMALRGGQASAAKVPLELRRANGLKGAIARWGTIQDNPAMPASRKNLDMNQLAKRILDEATGDEPKTQPPVKNQAAVESGARGGKKGGAARAAKLSPEQRAEIAKKAAAGRWKKA